ncbi:MAG TPA: site-specific DNA-methyltransferase [Steroidobacteraceae bacterium]|nr:site-specific DNA-methyltransferase [Steroidobacteraceae bacterium]
MTARKPAAKPAPAARKPMHAYRETPIGELIPFAGNPMGHPPAQIDLLCRLITEYGWTNPILIDGKRGIIAGHGRLLAAQKLGLTEVPTIELRGLSDAQKRAYIIADNESARKGVFDQDLLAAMLLDLRMDGFDLGLTGLDDLQLDRLLGPIGGLTDPDDAPEVQAVAVSRLGDVWTLGRHRICCGDATNPEHVAALMQGAVADLCFTSPPYAQQRDYGGDNLPWDDLMRGTFGILPVAHGAQVLVNLGLVHNDGEWLPYWDGWIAWMRAEGWRRFGWYVWDQGPGLPGDWNGRLAPSHEWIFHFNREAERARKSHASKMAGLPVGGKGLRNSNGVITEKTNAGGVYQARKIADTVIRVARQHGAVSDGDHPAVFPVALAAEIITAFSDPGDTVYEPFTGSGTQIIAAEQNNRTCLGMEVAPAYVDVCIRRWQQFTGQPATLDGRPFDAIAQERA